MPLSDILNDIGAVANPYGAPSQGQWNLVTGIYTTNISKKMMTLFFVDRVGQSPGQKTAIDQITDTGGRRLVRYEYPYRDGQRLADLGRKGEKFEFNILFYGVNYQFLFNQFLNIVVDTNEQGTLIHPVRGTFIVRFSDYSFMHSSDKWNAVMIKAVFEEDNTDTLNTTNTQKASSDSAIRTGLQTLTNIQTSISNAITVTGSLLSLPNSILNSMKLRLSSITNQVSGLLGQLAATFSSNANTQNLAAQSASVNGGTTALTSGKTVSATLPPVFQVGFDPTTQASINTQISNFVNSNQITPQQAVFLANQARTAIAAAISEVQTNFGNDGYETVVQYNTMAISIQTAVEACVAQTLSLVTNYIVPNPMSLRGVAQANGLPPDSQNAIEALNPYLPSVNYIPAGYVVVVPLAS